MMKYAEFHIKSFLEIYEVAISQKLFGIYFKPIEPGYIYLFSWSTDTKNVETNYLNCISEHGLFGVSFGVFNFPSAKVYFGYV